MGQEQRHREQPNKQQSYPQLPQLALLVSGAGPEHLTRCILSIWQCRYRMTTQPLGEQTERLKTWWQEHASSFL
jgi:hypothetical protein